jgi:hypothetical protein
MIARKTIMALADDDPGATIPPDRFWKKQIESNGSRWADRPAEMVLVYETDEAGFNQLVEKGKAASLWFAPAVVPFDRNMAWTYYRPGPPGGAPQYGLKIMGVLAAFGLLTCFWPGRFMETAIVWAPALFYYLAIFGVGDAVTRYLHPADWCWFVVIALGGDAILRVIGRLLRRRSPPEPVTAAPQLSPV